MPWRPALVGAAVGAAFLPLPPSSIERLYSTRFYAGLQPLLTSMSNLAPFALFDLFVFGILVCWVMFAVRDFRRVKGGLRIVILIVWRTIVWSAALYLMFLVAWGLNYRRVRLADALAVDVTRVTASAVRRAAIVSAGRMNALHDEAHREGWPPPDAVDRTLTIALERAVAEVRGPQAVVPGRPKRTLFDWYFRRAAVDGMVDPFFLEILVARDLLPFERPFIVAHEWSHLAGIADEGEANFVGWLACLRASPAAQYSGWLFLYGEMAHAADRGDRGEIAGMLEAGPRADLTAVRDRIVREVNPRVSAAGWRVYDSYLRANRVAAGAASYGEVVRLVLGAHLPSGQDPLAIH